MTTKKPIKAKQLNGELTIADSNHRWWVLHTKPRREKKIANYALKHNIQYYLPLKESVRKYKYRKVKFSKPLFPGYIFVKTTDSERNKLIVTGHVVNFMKVYSEKKLIEDLRNIYFGVDKKQDVENHPYLEKGYYVEFKSGPLKGVRGIVKSKDKLDQVVLQVRILHQAVSVKSDPSNLKLLSETKENDFD